MAKPDLEDISRRLCEYYFSEPSQRFRGRRCSSNKIEYIDREGNTQCRSFEEGFDTFSYSKDFNKVVQLFYDLRRDNRKTLDLREEELTGHIKYFTYLIAPEILLPNEWTGRSQLLRRDGRLPYKGDYITGMYAHPKGLLDKDPPRIESLLCDGCLCSRLDLDFIGLILHRKDIPLKKVDLSNIRGHDFGDHSVGQHIAARVFRLNYKRYQDLKRWQKNGYQVKGFGRGFESAPGEHGGLLSAMYKRLGPTALFSPKVNNNIEELYLRRNELGEQDVALLAEGIVGTSLKVLDLANNKIKDRGVAVIAEKIVGRSLEVLNLANNEISGLGAEDIVQALMVNWNGRLKELNLSDNSIGDNGAEAIKPLLVHDGHHDTPRLVAVHLSSSGARLVRTDYTVGTTH